MSASAESGRWRYLVGFCRVRVTGSSSVDPHVVDEALGAIGVYGCLVGGEDGDGEAGEGLCAGGILDAADQGAADSAAAPFACDDEIGDQRIATQMRLQIGLAFLDGPS